MTLNAMWIVGGFIIADWTAESDQAFAYFGWRVSSGDVNGDGYADVIVGAPFYDNGSDDEGLVSVYLGSAGGLAVAPAWTAESNQISAWSGWGAAGAGDVNGDGYADVIVGARLYDNVYIDEGQASLFHGSATGPDTTAAWVTNGEQNGAQYGRFVASAGDVDGDGFDDVIVGADAYDNGQEDEGRAFVYHGSPSGLSTAAEWSAEPNQASAGFGWVVGSAGDVDDDGYDDVLVGAPFYDNGSGDEGRVFVYIGSATGVGTDPAWGPESDQAGAQLGRFAAGAGDVNDDGFDDVLVGVPYFDGGAVDEGQAWLYLGSATGLEISPVWTVGSSSQGAGLGWSVASAGDLNADGYDDVVVGCLYCDGATTDGGAALVFPGSATGPDTTAEFILESYQAGSEFGVIVAPAGDVDGDGYDDLLVGADFYNGGEPFEGAAYLFAGTCFDSIDSIDSDGDDVGDRCDVCPGFDDLLDIDLDGLPDDCDLCPTTYDPMQGDDDGDGIGDACDPCPASTPDADADGICEDEDCDDDDPTVYPGAEELCDGLDNACTGYVPADERDGDGDGEPICAGDCDDADPGRFSGKTETCDGVDENCDGVFSDEVDADQDRVRICAGDCDDRTTRVGPGFAEICGDSIDNDCDGEIDQNCETGGIDCTCNGGGSTGGAPFLALALLVRCMRRRVAAVGVT